MYVKKAQGETSGRDTAATLTANGGAEWPSGRSLTSVDQPVTKVTVCEWRGVADHQ